MKTFIKILTGFVVLLQSVLFAQYDFGFDFSKAGSAGLQALKIGVGARETGMGESVVAVVNDANSVFWNPAGLAYVNNYQVSFSQNNWIVDSKQYSAVAAVSFDAFTAAISVSDFSINEFEETTVLNPEGTGRMVSAGDLSIGLSLAKRFTDKLSIGAQVKYLQEKLDDYDVNNVLFDFGAIYETGFRNLRLGFSFQHYGPDMKYAYQEFRAPLLFRIGAADEIINNDNLKITASAEVVHPTDNNEWVNAGTEIQILKNFIVRSGYRFKNDEGKLSFGVGIIPPELANMGLKIDYSFVKSEVVFEDIHRITIGFYYN